MIKAFNFSFAALILFSLLSTNLAAVHATVAVTKEADGILIRTPRDAVRLSVCGPDVIHVRAYAVRESMQPAPTPWILQSCNGAVFSLTQAHGSAVLQTAKLKIEISLDTGSIAFEDATGNPLLAEQGAAARTYQPLAGTQTGLYRVTENFQISRNDGL
jgi:alpha-glucosidase (family GH31 glycosyl hydrolase)